MNVSLTDPALLFPAIAILMLGYINRYIGAAQVMRTFKKDYDSGYKHTDVLDQVEIISRRLELFRYMLTLGAFALLLACLSMFLVYLKYQTSGNIIFGLSLVAMVSSLVVSLYETHLSNKSLMIEINDIRHREKAKRKA
jgi:hypothetical protein